LGKFSLQGGRGGLPGYFTLDGFEHFWP